MSDTVTIHQQLYVDLSECWEFAEDFDCLLQHRYAATPSFEAVMREIGAAMDWNVQQYAADAKPRLSPTELLNNVLSVYDAASGDCS